MTTRHGVLRQIIPRAASRHSWKAGESEGPARHRLVALIFWKIDLAVKKGIY